MVWGCVSSPRWQHRKTLNSPSLQTHQIHTIYRVVPLKEELRAGQTASAQHKIDHTENMERDKDMVMKGIPTSNTWICSGEGQDWGTLCRFTHPGPVSAQKKKKKSHSLKEELVFKRVILRTPPSGGRAAGTLSRLEGLANTMVYAPPLPTFRVQTEAGFWIP